MKKLKDENYNELKHKVLDLISVTSIEIGHRTDSKTLITLSRIFATDLMEEKRFRNLTFEQVTEGFKIGVRFGKDDPYINIRTFFKWLYEHKKRIDEAYYKVHTLNQPKEKTPYYLEPKKLLK